MSPTEELFLVAAVWTLIAIVIARFISNWPGRIAFVAVAVAVPFWELPYGYYNFQELCKHEGKLRVFVAIAPQRSVCVEYPFDTAAKSLLRFGFASIEARSKAGTVTRFDRSPSETLTNAAAEGVASDYCVLFVNNIRLPRRIYRHDFLITRSKGGNVVARHSVFDWSGMWWQEAASPILGRGGECHEDPIQPVMSAILAGAN